jgi:Carboxypeptidase regulatory-like domain
MRTLVAVALIAVALAGCSGSPSAPPPSDVPSAEELGLEATDSTGIIRGIVVDTAIRPIAGATVTLLGSDPRSAQTDETGAFGFDDLEPGTYFLKAKKLGYHEAQQSADVVAGVLEPAAVKVQLAIDASAVTPFAESYTYEGFVECTTSVLVLCGAPNLLTGDNITNDRFTWDQYLTPGASLIQSEMVWQSTQAASPEMYFEMEGLDGDCNPPDSSFFGSASGPSPIMARIDNETIEENEIGQVCPIYYSIFAGGIQGTPVGATVEQRFTMYIHAFYGYLPPDDWRFSNDSTVPPPPQ